MAKDSHEIERLEHVGKHLEIAYAGVVVSAAALILQRAEQDEEIATVLRHCVAPRLFEQIEQIGAVVARLRTRGSIEEPPETRS